MTNHEDKANRNMQEEGSEKILDGICALSGLLGISAFLAIFIFKETGKPSVQDTIGTLVCILIFFICISIKRLRKQKIQAAKNHGYSTKAKAWESKTPESEPFEFERENEQKRERNEEAKYSEKEPVKKHSLDWAYTLLGVSSTASSDEIRKAYLRKAKLHHPDLKGDGDVMRVLNSAYDALRRGN